MSLKRTALLLVAVVFASCSNKKDLTEVRAMTYNLSVGIDLDTIFAQPTFLDVQKQAEIAWHQKDQTDFAVRAKAIAAEIDAARPDLVGLQEVAQYYSGPVGGPATTLVKDFLQLLVTELQARGLDYGVATLGTDEGVVTNADVELTGADSTGALTADYRIVDREAVLARSGVQITQLRKGHFTAHIAVPIPGVPTPFPYYRGWVAVDGAKNGKAFTFLSTHLDAFDPRVQGAQALELLGLVSSSMPTLVVGDMNSAPQEVAWPADGILVSSTTGFADTGAEVGANASSCCRDPLLSDPAAPLTRRVDLVLHSPHFEAQSVALYGAAQADYSTTSSLWPSDHAGVSAVLGLE